MSKSNLSTPLAARDHARAQGGTVVRAMPTIPACAARDLPTGVSSKDVVWDETIDAGEYCARKLKRGSRLQIINLDGDASVNLIVLSADLPTERLNVADTIKVQWNGYLREGSMLLSDMGRVMMSILQDTSGRHDTFCGASNEKSNANKYGQADNYSPHPNARDRFLLSLLKFGLGKKDIPPSINLFKKVTIEGDGGLAFDTNPGKPGEHVVLRAEMNVIIAAANTPHVLDPRSKYVATPARLLAYHGCITPEEDPIRRSNPESLRAFQNTEDYFVE